MERPELIEFGGHEYLVNEGLAPAEARAALRTDVLDSLARAGVHAFAVRGPSVARSRIGIMESERTRALEALASGLTGPATYLEEIYPEIRTTVAAAAHTAGRDCRATSLLGRPDSQDVLHS